MKYLISLAALLSFPLFIYGQTGQPMGQPINTAMSNEFYPSISADGKTMLFMSDYGRAETSYPMISYLKGGVWTRPEEIPSLNSPAAKLTNNSGFNLSPDGNFIFFSSSRYGGLGSNDVWYSEKTGNSWSAPKNLLKPVNSPGSEGDPSLSPDGKQLFFVRYSDKKGPQGQPCGKIFVAERINKDTHREPRELPAKINAGCECAPRMLADGKTMYFSSIRQGGKGGYDLYKTVRQADGAWSDPVPLSFLNTSQDDQYVSVPASGEIIFYSFMNNKSLDVYRSMIPADLKPDKVMLLQGSVKDASGMLLPARIVVNDADKNQLRSIFPVAADGSYMLLLPAGTRYDVSASHTGKGFFHSSAIYALDTLTKYRIEEKNFTLQPLKLNSAHTLKINFEGNTDKITASSQPELQRLLRILQENPEMKIEIGTHTDEIISDTIPSPGLTEIKTDSIMVEDSLVIKTKYHNDVTPKQAKAIGTFLESKGISKERFICRGYGDSKPGRNEAADRKRVEVRVMVL